MVNLCLYEGWNPSVSASSVEVAPDAAYVRTPTAPMTKVEILLGWAPLESVKGRH